MTGMYLLVCEKRSARIRQKLMALSPTGVEGRAGEWRRRAEGSNTWPGALCVQLQPQSHNPIRN